MGKCDWNKGWIINFKYKVWKYYWNILLKNVYNVISVCCILSVIEER